MSVLDGPRQEWRRVLHEGQPKWVRPEGDRLLLGDGRHIADSEATYLPPCDPTKILCIHLNYDSRRVEFKAPMLETPTYFQKPVTALNSHRGVLCRPAGHKYLNYEGEVGVIIGKPRAMSVAKRVGTISRDSRLPMTSDARTIATPTPARCSG